MKQILFVIFIINGFFTPVFSHEVAYKDAKGKWRVIDSADWPKMKTGVKNARQFVKGANISFIVNYADVASNTDVGFDDPILGAQRRTIVLNVLTYIGSIVSESGVCDIEFLVSETDGTNYLASGGTFLPYSPNGFYNGYAYSHIKTGFDPDLSVPDIETTFDFGWNWNSAMGDPTGTQVDLYSVLLHELTHGLGLLSLVGPDGKSDISSSNPGIFSVWDNYLVTGNGKDLFGGAGSFLGTPSDLLGGDGGIKFTGPNATAVYGSNPPIYAPSSWQSGSSISHWDTGAVTGNPLMTHAIGYGVKKREFVPFEIQALKDLGYTLKTSDVENWNMY